MLKKSKKSIDEIIPKSDTNNTFESADKKEQEHKELKKVVETIAQGKKAGRPMIGKSLTKHKIAFYVNSEQLEYLESLTNRKERTPNAVAKKIVLNAFELHNKS